MKQYLLLVDDNTKAFFELLCSKLQFLEIQGLNLNGENKLQMLATPVYPPVNQAIVEPVAQVPAEVPEPVEAPSTDAAPTV